MKFSNLRFLLLFFTSKLAVPLLSTQISDFSYFLSLEIREFGGITVAMYKIIEHIRAHEHIETHEFITYNQSQSMYQTISHMGTHGLQTANQSLKL